MFEPGITDHIVHTNTEMPQLTNLIRSTILEKIATSCGKDVHGHVCQPMQSSQTKNFAKPFCLQTTLFTNKSMHELRCHYVYTIFFKQTVREVYREVGSQYPSPILILSFLPCNFPILAPM